MNILFFVLSVALFYFVSFKLPPNYPKRKLCIYLGSSLILIPLAFFLTLKIIYALVNYSGVTELTASFICDFLIKLTMTLITISLVNLASLIVADLMIDNSILFHQKYNTANLNKNPVKFVLANKEKIKMAYKIFFMLGACLGFYGIWLDSN